MPESKSKRAKGSDPSRAPDSDACAAPQSTPPIDRFFRDCRPCSAPEGGEEDAPEPNCPPAIVLALLLACCTGLLREDRCNRARRDVGANAITVNVEALAAYQLGARKQLLARGGQVLARARFVALACLCDLQDDCAFQAVRPMLMA